MTASTASPPPVACSLSSADLRDRLERMRELADTALVRREGVPGGRRLTFAGGEGLEAELRAIAAAEAECCGFLAIDVRRSGQSTVVTITGPEEAAPLIGELFA